MSIKKGDLVRMTHIPYKFGIVIDVSWRAVWVWWAGDESKSGYEPSLIYNSMEVVNE